ncbi:hypothetical protein SLA2020_033600 [Shorea laevis]
MSSYVIKEAKKLWATWNIRVFIIVSLSVQVFLILSAPLRKTKGKKMGKCVYLLIWSVYLLADWVAGFAIGLIVSRQIKSPAESSDIQVFWAPFLLLHLGGPDTITSFALEDNEFWVRHLLGLLLQIGSTAYVFVKSLPENKLWLPTILVFVAGIIKYAERNRAFYLASFEHLGDGWMPSEWGDELPIPVEFRMMDKPMKKIKKSLGSILWTAVHHFGTIKMTLVGPFFSPDQCSDIRETFLQLKNASHVLQVLEIELSLLYEVLHTKLPVVGCMIGYILRFITMSFILGALLSFSLFKKNYELRHFDIWLTYGLLIGALLLEFISIILLSFSDWILGAHYRSMESRCFNKSRSFIKSNLSKSFNKRRWSRAVSQLNFITYHVKYSPTLLKDIADLLDVRVLFDTIKGILCLSFKDFKEDPEWRFIFKEVKSLSKFLIAGDAPRSTGLEASQAWRANSKQALERFSNSTDIINIVEELDYTKSVLTWHIATEICYQQEELEQRSKSGTREGTGTKEGTRTKEGQTFGSGTGEGQTSGSGIGEGQRSGSGIEEGQTSGSGTGEGQTSGSGIEEGQNSSSGIEEGQKSAFKNSNYKEMCKLLSDYMFYLLVMQPAMMAAISVSWKIVFEDTLAETESLVSRTSISNTSNEILQLIPKIGNPKRDMDRSVLFAASALANQLKKSSDWKSMSKVWVHLMCFAAINSRPQVHAQQPSKGGELLTFVWLLMNHLGVGTQFSSHY